MCEIYSCLCNCYYNYSQVKLKVTSSVLFGVFEHEKVIYFLLHYVDSEKYINNFSYIFYFYLFQKQCYLIMQFIYDYKHKIFFVI